MPVRRAGALALVLLGLSGALGVYGAVRGPAATTAAVRGLALDAPLPARVPPGVTLTIGDPLTEWALRQTGWDRDLPFRIQWAEISGGPAVTEAFHAHALDVGAAANIPPIHAVFVGMPVKMVAVRFRADPEDHPSFVFAIAPKARIASLADLRGKRIAYSPGQVQGEIVLRTLEAQHLTPKDVTLVELPSTSADVYVNALAGGLLDVAPIGAGAPVKRYLDRFGAQGAKVLKHAPYRDDLVTLYVREDTLRDPAKAAAIAAYVRLWGRVQAWTNAHPREGLEAYYAKNQGLTAADAAYAAQAVGRTTVPDDWGPAIGLQQASIDTMASVTGHRPFAAETLFDRRFERLAAGGVADFGATARRLAAR